LSIHRSERKPKTLFVYVHIGAKGKLGEKSPEHNITNCRLLNFSSFFARKKNPIVSNTPFQWLGGGEGLVKKYLEFSMQLRGFWQKSYF